MPLREDPFRTSCWLDSDSPASPLDWQAYGLPHPDSPAGSVFDWSSVGFPHPNSPAGRVFDWSAAGLRHPDSPISGTYVGTGSGSVGATASPPLDAGIEALDLAPAARKAAYELKNQFPSVRFTSGRRNKQEQAHAMASNVVLNRTWIKETYVPSDARDACQKWVDDNPGKKKISEVAAGLEKVLNGLSDAQLAHLSKHLSGDAFDVQPVEQNANEIKKAIRTLPGLDKFLEKEGGLVRWHAQF